MVNSAGNHLYFLSDLSLVLFYVSVSEILTVSVQLGL